MTETSHKVAPFEKVVRPASEKTYYGLAPVFVTIQWDGKKLSLTGVVGPMSNGNAKGGCGQCIDFGAEELAPGWDAVMVAKLREVWRRWHLNDMRAGCEHQRAEGWGKETLEVVSYKLNDEGWKLKKQAEREATLAAMEGRVANLTATGRALIPDSCLHSVYSPPDADHPLSGLYEVEKRENKLSTWVYEKQHPRGVLSRPCPVCGYKFGSAWLHEDVPTDVLEWLQSLPDTDTKPAWH